jgi:phage terminase large subunit-like protein
VGQSQLEQLARRLGPEGALAKLRESFSAAEIARLLRNWDLVGRPEQHTPPGKWVTWLALAGRGWGKTRAGSEFTIRKARAMPGSRGFLAARTAGDVRDVAIEGESGILACSPPGFYPRWQPSKRRLTWPNGAQASTFSSDVPDAGRGPQYHWGWGDELAAWYDFELWDNLEFGLRLGQFPQAMVTTTPKPVATLREMVKASQFGPDPESATVYVTKGRTYDNIANLAPAYIAKVIKKYEGTRQGRQELEAELLDDTPGALWSRALIDALRVRRCPELQRIVVAVDPAVTSGEQSDMTGIIVAGLGVDGLGYVLADLTCKMSPADWAARAVAAYHLFQADELVAEVNNGGDLVEAMIRLADKNVVYRKIHASRGKRVRAEPVSALYEQKKVRHVIEMVAETRADGTIIWRQKRNDERHLVDLEDQQVQYTPMGFEGSPDRVDALVYALSALLVEEDEGANDLATFLSQANR